MEGRGRSRARKKAKFFSPKRLTSFLLAAAMVCTNIGSDLSTAYAAGTSSEVTFEMRGADLTAAVEEAIVSENVVTPDDLNFTNGKVDDFKGYLFGEGKLYEAYPEMEGGDVEADMRVFVRLPEDADDMYAVTGDEEVIFLYINNSDETVRFRSRINYMVDGEEKVKQTDSVTVRSYESIFGDEEVNVISDPVEEIPETTVPETEEVPETPAEDPVATESEMTVSMSPNAAALVSAPGEEATPSEWPEDETDAEVPETMAPEEETAVPAEEDPAAEETTEAAETIPVATPSETPAATDSEIENAPKPSYSDIVGIGWSGTAKVYASTLNKLHALDDVEGWKVEYSITPEGSARIVDGARGVEDGEDLYFGVKNQIGYAVETVLANGEELTADTITDNEDGSQTAWYAVYGVTEEQSIDVVMAETGEHPAFEQTLAMDDGMQISIKAEAGVLPVGVEATAERVSQEVEAAVVESASAEGKTLTSVYAYDINLWLNGQLLDSEIWGGSKRVQVTFSGDPVKEASEQASAVEVLHVETVQDTDQEAKEKAAVQEEEIKAEDVLGIETVSEVVEVPAEESVDAVSFEAEHFTVYAVAARASEVSFGDFEMMLGETVTVNSDADSSSYNHKWSVAQSDIISVKGDGRSATVTALNLGEVTLTHEYYTGFLNRHEEQATVKVVSNEGMVKVEWYINGEVVETDWVNEGERPTYDGTQPNRQIRFSDGSSANMKFKGWATEPNSKNFSDVEDLPGVTEDTKYYAIFSYDALFYFVLEGKSNTSTNANDYMFAGPDYSNDTAVYGEVIIPDGFGGASRWYVGSQLSTDIDSYIIDGTTDAAIRKGLDQAYDDYDSRWEYTIDWTTLSFAGSSVGYYKDWNGNYITISSQQVLHVDGAVILDKETTAGIQYVVTNPDREVVTASKTHNKGEAVEINSTVRDSGNFTTDGETYEATQWYGGELYRFDGWYEDFNYTTKAPETITVTKRQTFYARYVKVDTYRVYYDWGNPPEVVTDEYVLPVDRNVYEEGDTYQVDQGDFAPVLEYDAYGNVDGRWTFSGWTDPNNGVMGEADVTVTGEWDYEAVEVATHKVSYSWTDAPDGEYAKELPSEITGLVKSEPYAIDTVYHEGYTVDHFDAYGNVDGRWTFSGWTDPNNGVMGEADVTVTGSWSYEVLVTYRVVNGSWDSADSGNTKDIQRWVLLTDGQYILTENDIPVAYPNTGYRNGVWYPIPQEAIITKTSNKLFVISFERDVYEARVEFYFENVDDILVEKSEEDYGRPFIIVPEESLIYNDHQYALDKIEGNGVIITEDPDQNVIKVYYGLDEIGGKDPENPNTPDGVPDKYQTTVMFAAVNGTVDGKTQAEKVVTLTDADGKPSETGSYILTEEDIPEAVAATGYSQDSKTWDVEPVGAEIKAEGTKNTFTVTFYPADQTFTVQYIDEDTNEGLKEQDVFNAKYGTYVDGEAFARPFEGYTFTRATELWVTEDNQINYVFVYYSKDVIGGGEDPNTPDEVPDKYQTFVVFAAVNGTVDGETQVEKVVTLTDADGKWSADGSYTLKEEDIPEAVAAVGYDQATATWDSENPASPVGSVIDNGEDTKVTFTVTFSPADQTYIVQYIDEDTNEGLKEQDVFNAKYGDYINGADHAIEFEGYTFTRATELWVTEDNQINYVFVYYSKDEVGPEGPDDVPDKYQLVFTYVSADPATGTVTGKTVEVKTFKDEAGNYTEVKPTSPNTMDGHNPVPTAADGYAFAYWTEEGKDERDYTFNMTYTLGQKEYTENTTFVAHFLKDEGGKEDPNQPDGKPDEYQIKFTYVTEDPAHGTFAGVNEVSEILDRPTNIDGSPNMEAGVSPTVSVTITENGRYRFDHWTDAAGTEYTTEELRNATFTADATFTAHFRYISSSGGNGGGSGSSGGTGPYTPSTGGPGAAIIGDNDVPLAPLPTENNGGNIVIFDDSVPLAPLPKTGQQSSKAPVTMLLTGIFLMFASLKRRKEEKQ